jgi:hypothetical protein
MLFSLSVWVTVLVFAGFLAGFGGRHTEILRGLPAIAPPMSSVNGIGEQRCNASITAIR